MVVRNVSIFLLCSIFAFMGMAFTNCGKVEFTEYQDTDQVLTTPREDSIVEKINLTMDEFELILAGLPEQERQNPRPVSDLEAEPKLGEVYDCGDGSVVICHFPDNVEESSTMCIGYKAIPKFSANYRTYDLGDGEKSIVDYLGPCRIRL